ncbi:MAG TPA: hypothetical protein VM051_10890 [Usitatibacter sp.]|nr:hypothetical protein [Usitatibacter sp.]
MTKLWRRAWKGVRRRLFPRKVYHKAPMRVRPPRAAPPDASSEGLTWQACLRTVEVDDAAPLAGWLFKRRFGTDVPVSPRHFVLLYSPAGNASGERAVAYIHHQRLGEIYLTGGLCVDERAYRSFPAWLFAKVREQGGLATIMTLGSMAMLGDGAAVFGHVGELRSRQASLRSGFADTDDDHLMVYWLAPLDAEEKKRLIAIAASRGPF